MKRFALLAIVPLFCASVAGAQTPADLETARLLFTQANELHDKGDLSGALLKYKAAHVLAHTPVTGFELGKAYAELGMLVEARDALVGVAALPVKPGESEKTTHARAESAKLAAELRGRIPTLTILLDGAPPGSTPTVIIDGVAVDASTLGLPRVMNPGPHTVRASVAGGAPRLETVSLKEGELRTLAVHVEGPPPVAPPPPRETVESPEEKPAPPPTKPPPKRLPPPPPPEPTSSGKGDTGLVVAFSVGGVGLGSFAAMTITGAMASSRASTVAAHCNAAKQCDTEGLDAAASGRTLATVANVTLAAGTVLVATGIIVGIATRKSASPTAAFVIAPTVGGASLGFTLQAW